MELGARSEAYNKYVREEQQRTIFKVNDYI